MRLLSSPASSETRTSPLNQPFRTEKPKPKINHMFYEGMMLISCCSFHSMAHFLKCVTPTGCQGEINRRKWSGESLLSLSHVPRVLFQTAGLIRPLISRPSSIIQQQLLYTVLNLTSSVTVNSKALGSLQIQATCFWHERARLEVRGVTLYHLKCCKRFLVALF